MVPKPCLAGPCVGAVGNHFHLLLETPEPNLSAGMRVTGSARDNFQRTDGYRSSNCQFLFRPANRLDPSEVDETGDAALGRELPRSNSVR